MVARESRASVASHLLAVVAMVRRAVKPADICPARRGAPCPWRGCLMLCASPVWVCKENDLGAGP